MKLQSKDCPAQAIKLLTDYLAGLRFIITCTEAPLLVCHKLNPSLVGHFCFQLFDKGKKNPHTVCSLQVLDKHF